MEPTDESLALLSRLSAKPGVQSTLVLSRADGAIVRSTGLLARTTGNGLRPGSADSNYPAVAGAGSFASTGTNTVEDAAANGAGQGSSAAVLAESGEGQAVEPSEGEQVAAMVWRFVRAAGELVTDLDGDDELKLLRVRTKKNELVVVPNAKFLLVVVHDTPPA